MMQMMRLGRADIAVGLEPAVRYAMQQNDPENQFEIIEPALFSSSVYFAFGKSFAKAHPALTRQIWEQIRLFSAGQEWQTIKAQVMKNQLPPTPQLEQAVQLGLEPDSRAP
jgi:ABC-type amino acid transport substrate-binding protein